jgi:hypothetical protein
MWRLQRRRARAQASHAVLWRCLRIGPTTGRGVQIHVVFEQSDPKFRRLLDQLFYGQCPQPLSYGSGVE